MKVIFVAPSANIPNPLKEKLEKHAEVFFFEDNPIDIRNIPLLKEKGEKILCPFPEPISWNFPNDFIKEIPDLKGICLSTTSFSWIDGKLARGFGVSLTNVPNPPNGVAEGAIFMMLSVAKKYPTVFKEEKFQFIPSNFVQEVCGKKMGIVGLGKIGSRVAELGIGLGMDVYYWSRKSRDKGLKFLELDDLLKTCDFIFICVAFNLETTNLISKEKLNLIKSSSSLITIANDKIMDLNYVLELVKDKKLYGLAFESDTAKLTDYAGNVFVTKHTNWYTKETVSKKMEIWIENIIGVINGKPPNLVN